VPGPYALEGALDLATAGLEPLVVAAAGAVARIRASSELARAKELASNEVRYYVDTLGERLEALDQLFGVRASVAGDDDHVPAYETKLIREGDRHREVRMRARAPHHPHRTPSSRDALIAGIAEVMLYERALPTLLDPHSHAVTVVLSRIGQANSDGMVLVTQAYTNQPGWFDSGASADDKGDIATFGAGKSSWPWDKWQAYWRARRDVALVLRGLFIRAAVETDHGTWLIRAATAEPDVVRVEVSAGAVGPPADVLRDHIAARKELDRVLEAGGALPRNPDSLLPVTRTIAYQTPPWTGAPVPIEVEDFATSWVDRGKRDITTAMRRLWHVAWSRVRSEDR
jgi:hypothetical protein